MKILISISDTKYMLWQLLVQQTNFAKLGYDVDTIYVVSSKEVSSELANIMHHPEIKAKFYVYTDTRENKKYTTSIRQHTFEKFFRENPEMENETFFYIDVDVLFTRAIDFDSMLDDEYWHCSDSSSYVGIDYLKKNGGSMLFAQMCDVVGMNSQLIESIPAGGAQYLMKGLTADYWAKSYEDAGNMYKLLKSNIIVQNKPNLVNAWCADMWVTLWNSVYLGKQVKINPELSFAWATDSIDKWSEKAIFHLAGAVKGKKGFFNKQQYYNETPFGKPIEVADTNCTYNYVLAIKEVEQKFKDILF